jgi:hypothetical protein
MELIHLEVRVEAETPAEEWHEGRTTDFWLLGLMR